MIKAAAARRPAPVNEAARTFGLHVAAIRRSRGMTLDRLADTTGLNKGHLSRLERAEKAPSIATVMKIAQAFDVPVSALFGDAVEDALIHVVRARDVRSRLAGESTFEPLSRIATSVGPEAFLLHPGPDFGSDGRASHGGTEIMFVVSGDIEVQFADRTLVLGTGDFLQFPGHLVHQVRGATGGASALIVVTRER